MCDKLAVMYAGKIVEAGSVRELFDAAQHPYTKALLGSMPKLGSKEKLLRDPRPAARPGDPAAGLRVPPALPRGAAVLRQRRAARDADRRAALDGALLACRAADRGNRQRRRTAHVAAAAGN